MNKSLCAYLKSKKSLNKSLTDIELKELRKYWRQDYQRRKKNPKYMLSCRIRGNRYWKRHTFKRIVKAIRKKDKKSTIASFDLWKIAKSQRLICPLTGRKLTNENISPDHINHRSNGGLSNHDNIRLVVKEVNLARHILTDDAFITLCRDVVSHNLQ